MDNVEIVTAGQNGKVYYENDALDIGIIVDLLNSRALEIEQLRVRVAEREAALEAERERADDLLADTNARMTFYEDDVRALANTLRKAFRESQGDFCQIDGPTPRGYVAEARAALAWFGGTIKEVPNAVTRD